MAFDQDAQDIASAALAKASTALQTLNGAIEINGDLYPGIDPTGTSDCTTAMTALIIFANGRPIRLDGLYRIKHLYIGDYAVHFRGKGTWIHQQGDRVMLVRKAVTDTQPVSSVARFAFGPAGGGSTLNMTKIACSGAHHYAYGDIASLNSADKYPWCVQYAVEQGYSSLSVYLGDLIKISAVGQDYTGKANGGFLQGDVVTGATSGSTAIVRGVGNNGQTTDSLIFRSMSGLFVNGENLLVGGTVRGVAYSAAYLVTSELLTYEALYQTNITVGKMGTTPFVMEGMSVQADGDVDAVVGSAQRTAPFVFEGCVRPIVRDFTIKSAWTRAFRYSSSFAPIVDGLVIQKLPNNANSSESAYGYGIDCANATAYGDFRRISGGNCRHAFTTNTDGDVNGDNYAARTPHYYDGAPKYNNVTNCHIVDNVAEPFDTHPGDLFTTFTDCTAEWGDGVGQNITGAGGFKTRGFGTRYVNCRSYGGTVGFNDYSGGYDAGFKYDQHYLGCRAERYAKDGFAITQTPFDQSQRTTIWEDCWIGGFQVDSTTPFYPYGFSPYFSGQAYMVLGGGADRWIGSPLRVSSDQHAFIKGFTLNWRHTTTGNATTIRVEGKPAVLMIDGLFIIRHVSNPSAPSSAIRHMTSLSFYAYIKNVSVSDGIVTNFPDIPLVIESGGGKITPYYRDNGRIVVIDNAVPTGGRPDGGNWPVGSQVQFPAPSAGGWQGATCVTAGAPGTWKRFGAVEA